MPHGSPLIDPPLEAAIEHGANFATTSSIIRLPTSIIRGISEFSPFRLDMQFQ